jgi:hypothetical protein
MHDTCMQSHIQALDTGEGGHSIEYATKCEIKPLNRFANIVVCKLTFLAVLYLHTVCIILPGLEVSYWVHNFCG